MRLEFHPEALTEYKAAAYYYESVRESLGARFIDAVEAALQHVVESPQTWREIDDGIRRCLTRVFP
jgi:toxin ParE1/3/4